MKLNIANIMHLYAYFYIQNFCCKRRQMYQSEDFIGICDIFCLIKLRRKKSNQKPEEKERNEKKKMEYTCATNIKTL